MSRQTLTPIVLGDDRRRVTVLPQLGGRISSFQTRVGQRWIDWLHPFEPPRLNSKQPARGGCYVLAPYCNRIANGHFEFRGRRVELDAHSLAVPHSLHGVAWTAAWTVDAVTSTGITLSMTHAGHAGSWPWAFTLTQNVAITETGLEIRLELRNIDRVAQPVGLGLHPFFPKGNATRIAFRARGHWQADSTLIPTRLEPVPSDLDFSDPRTLPARTLDEGFCGWERSARLSWPDETAALTLRTSAALSHLTLFAPAGGDFVCIEPVSHATNAVNMIFPPGTQGAMHVLEPGAVLQARACLIPTVTDT